MAQYRIYCFDDTGKVGIGQSIEALGDEAAIITARGMDIGTRCELWQGRRLAATVDRA